jgi:CRP-like cAMP-binding protein
MDDVRMNRPPVPPPPRQKPAPATQNDPQAGADLRDSSWGSTKLAEIGILKKFTQAELNDLYSKGEVKVIKPSSYAVIEGEPSRGLYLILKGGVSVYKNDLSGGAMRRIAMLEEGSYFGELSLFDKHPRAATVAAESVVKLFYLDADVFERFLNDHGDDAKIRFYRQCAEELAQRFRILNSDYIGSQQMLWKYALRKADEAKATVADKKSSEKDEL